MSKLSTIMHIGKIVFSGVVIALEIAALFTPAAPIIIAAAVFAALAWASDTGEDMIEDYYNDYSDESTFKEVHDYGDDISDNTTRNHNSEIPCSGETE